jgi:hypothetical protein
MSVVNRRGHTLVIDSWQTISSEVRDLLVHTAYDPSCAAELWETLSELDDFFSRFAHPTWSPGLSGEMIDVVRHWRVLSGLLPRGNLGPKVSALHRVFQGYLDVYRTSLHVTPEDSSNLAQFCGQLGHAAALCGSPDGEIGDVVEWLAFGLGLMSGLIEKITATSLDGVHREADAAMREFAEFRTDIVRADDLLKLMQKFVAVQDLAEALGGALMDDMAEELRVATERGAEMANGYRREAAVLRKQADAVGAMRADE